MKWRLLFLVTPFLLLSLFVSPIFAQASLCQSDINQDTVVDLSDYSILASNFLKSIPSNPRADINSDGIVDLSDYSLLAVSFLRQATNCQQTATPTPSPTATSPATTTNEWTQHAFNAQHTSYSPQEIPTPWRWKWSWNGPNSSGGISSGKTSLPRNVQPVTGAGRVYMAAGNRGVFALNQQDANNDRLADVVWNATNVGTINSTVAYDSDTQSVFAVSANGRLYKLNASNGSITSEFNAGASSTLPLPPIVLSDRVVFSMGTKVFAINKTTMRELWVYEAGSQVHTPPAYSAIANTVIAVSQDLFVHAVNNNSGARNWRIKPTVRTGTSPNEAVYGWPVIAESQGLALIKYRLDWDTLWTWNPWPTTNAAIRANLQSRPDQQALFAMRLTDGSSPFIMNVGHGGYGDGGYMPMGPQPVIKTLSGGSQIAYMVGRGDNQVDGRWDSKFVEIPLDNTTVSGYSGGEVRFITYNHTVLTDEQPNISMAGNHLLAGHWMAGYALNITDRSPSLGSYSNRIRATDLPHITTSASNCGFSASHYCASRLVQDGDPRTYPAGHYIYYNQGTVYDNYWSSYATYVASNNTIYFRSTDGAIVALESGVPTASDIQSVHPLAWLNKVKNNIFGAFTNIASHLISLAQADTIIDYSQAGKFSGSTTTIDGQIKYIFNNGKTILLGFEYPHQGVFKVQIPKDIWSQFGTSFGSQMGRNLETHFREGDWIQVTGRIDWYQGDPVIYLINPSQINIDKKR